MTGLEIFAALIIGHFVADYPLQGDFVARGKNRTAPIAGIPWQHPMMAHCVIHAGAVWLITGWWAVALAELAAHWATDDAKCRGRIGYHTDQAIHVFCKLLWVWAIYAMGGQP